MPILPQEAYNIKIPQMYDVKQVFPDESLKNIDEAILKQITDPKIRASIKPGASVAVLVGSRGIASLKEVTKATVDGLRVIGADPFIVPSMGSHGGGVAKMQTEIIEGYGVTEEYVGAPIRSSMETVIIAETSSGIPVHIDKIASEADVIVPVARIKTHTDYEAPIESGLCKMLAIGLGKHNGCSRLHQEGFSSFPKLIPEVAAIMLSKFYFPFGVAVVENAHENVHSVHIVSGEEFLTKEPELLTLSKSLMPKLQFDEIDVLIVEQIGKNISGAGMDPNITGIMSSGRISGFSGPYVKRIVALGLTPETHNNATGIGIADFTTKSVYESIDPISTYANCIASGNPEAGRIPILLDNEEDAIRAALQTAPRINLDNPKVVRIKSTLDLIDIKVSKALLEHCQNHLDKFRVSV